MCHFQAEALRTVMVWYVLFPSFQIMGTCVLMESSVSLLG